MKDEKGHGSDAHGGPAHQAGVEQATKPASLWEGKSGEFTHGGSANLAKQGFTPTGRAGGNDLTGAARVAWKYAQQIGKPVTLTHTGRGGLTVVKDGLKIPYGQSHMVVHPNGDVHRYNLKGFGEGG